jgi:hypothetical protein
VRFIILGSAPATGLFARCDHSLISPSPSTMNF